MPRKVFSRNAIAIGAIYALSGCLFTTVEDIPKSTRTLTILKSEFVDTLSGLLEVTVRLEGQPVAIKDHDWIRIKIDLGGGDEVSTPSVEIATWEGNHTLRINLHQYAGTRLVQAQSLLLHDTVRVHVPGTVRCTPVSSSLGLHDIQVDSIGFLWLPMGRSLTRWDEDSGRFLERKTAPGTPYGFNEFEFDKHGKVWFITEAAIPAKGPFTKFRLAHWDTASNAIDTVPVPLFTGNEQNSTLGWMGSLSIDGGDTLWGIWDNNNHTEGIFWYHEGKWGWEQKPEAQQVIVDRNGIVYVRWGVGVEIRNRDGAYVPSNLPNSQPIFLNSAGIVHSSFTKCDDTRGGIRWCYNGYAITGNRGEATIVSDSFPDYAPYPGSKYSVVVDHRDRFWIVRASQACAVDEKGWP